MKKLQWLIPVLFLFMGLSFCEKKTSITIPARELAQEEKFLLGRWKARSTQSPEEEPVWEFQNNGIVVIRSSAMEYNGKFLLKGKTMTIEMTMSTLRYIVIEKTENSLKLETRINNVPSQTLLTRIAS